MELASQVCPALSSHRFKSVTLNSCTVAPLKSISRIVPPDAVVPTNRFTRKFPLDVSLMGCANAEGAIVIVIPNEIASRIECGNCQTLARLIFPRREPDKFHSR